MSEPSKFLDFRRKPVDTGGQFHNPKWAKWAYSRIKELESELKEAQEQLSESNLLVNIDKVKLIVDLTLAKVEILKLKADDYAWASYVDDETKSDLFKTLEDIDREILLLRNPVVQINAEQ